MCWKRAVISVVDYVIDSLVSLRIWIEPPTPPPKREISQDTQDELTAAAADLLQSNDATEPAAAPTAAHAAKVELKSAEILPTKNIKICLEITAGSNGFSIFIPPNQQEGFDRQPERPPQPQRPPSPPPADFGEDDVKIKLDMGSFALPEEDLRTRPVPAPAPAQDEEDVNVDEFQTPNDGTESGSEDDI